MRKVIWCVMTPKQKTYIPFLCVCDAEMESYTKNFSIDRINFLMKQGVLLTWIWSDQQIQRCCQPNVVDSQIWSDQQIHTTHWKVIDLHMYCLLETSSAIFRELLLLLFYWTVRVIRAPWPKFLYRSLRKNRTKVWIDILWELHHLYDMRTLIEILS